MSDQRPDPDELLARIQDEEARLKRGKYKIFFGAAAGVGKTYAMLEAAQEQHAQGVDVVAGHVETHQRADTETLLAGLEQLPARWVEYRGVKLREFDLDAALVRHPDLILVDELAHSNAPGSRHAKRWQDVEELLESGISVWTTLNVQHLESLNDVVTQITGIPVRETIPDWIVEEADEIEVIDLSPDELLQRLKEGRVYIPQQAERAIQNFFRKGNLMALRELALRRTADRVDAQMQDYRRDKAIGQTWPAKERLLVCVGPSQLSPRLIRSARRMAASLDAEWLAVYVETREHFRLPEADQSRIEQTLSLAEELGAETAMLSGTNVAEEILAYAHVRNVSKIIVGKPLRSRWHDLLFGSIVDDLVRCSGKIDVYVITGEINDVRPAPLPRLERTSRWPAYAWSLVTVGICTFIARAMLPGFELSSLIMIYLLGVVFAATRLGRGPSIVTSILSVAAFDFFFVPPYLTFAVSDTQYILTFGTMLFVALVISNLTVQLRQQAEAVRQRERRTTALYALSREFSSKRGLGDLAKVAQNHIGEVFESQVTVLLPEANGRLKQLTADQPLIAYDAHERSVAQWAYDHNQIAGLGTATLPGAEALYLPLSGSQGTVGVLRVYPAHAKRFQNPEQMHLLETFANQTALAIERARLAEDAAQAQIQIETERMRNSLLSSVSHDLRTPLATITGAASSLLDEEQRLDAELRRDLAQAIYEEASRLDRLVRNLLDMTRLESGAVQVQKEWQPLEEVIGVALARLADQLHDRSVTTQLPIDLPLVPLDGVLVEQVLVNLLENAIKYTSASSPIDISASAAKGEVKVVIADRGPGLPAGDEQRVFEKFYRTPKSNTSGVGLGLTICRGIIEAHGGRIWAENRAGGGASFCFTLPLDGQPPEFEAEDIELFKPIGNGE